MIRSTKTIDQRSLERIEDQKVVLEVQVVQVVKVVIHVNSNSNWEIHHHVNKKMMEALWMN